MWSFSKNIKTTKAKQFVWVILSNAFWNVKIKKTVKTSN